MFLVKFFFLGVPYDIGFGQKLYLKCTGSGKPTGNIWGDIGGNNKVVSWSVKCMKYV